MRELKRMDIQTRVVKKKKWFNKLKQNTERFLIYIFALIGMLATLNFAINTFREAGEWYFHERISSGVMVSAVTHAEPIEVHSVKSEREQEETQAPLLLEIDEIIDRIAILESSNGKNQPKYCTDRGLINKWGYGIYGDKILCFKSEEEGRKEISRWFKEKSKNGYSISQMLCGYNTGNFSEDCEYLQAFNSLN